jgi:cytochrome c nitrite reductase small subunit
MTPFRLAVVLVCLLGIPVGIGAFTFVYAKGFSYLSTDPRACVECHLPDRGLAKWVAKADHGFRHSMAFTLQNFKEPIEITPGDREIVRANCLRCPAASRV